MKNFENKIAVITGGASGIGQGIARALVDTGAKLVIADIDEEAAKRCADEFRDRGARVLAVHTDVRKNDSVQALITSTLKEFGRVDLLFNNAGVYLGGEMRNITEDDWRFVMDVNLDGVFRVGQAFAALFRTQGRGGHIVNTASVAGFVSDAGGLAYAVSKFGVVAYSEAMRQDLAPDGIGVSTLCPGAVQTNLPTSDRLRESRDQHGGTSETLAPGIRDGLMPDEVGLIVLSGIRRNLPYIFTDVDAQEHMAERFGAVLADFDRIGVPPVSTADAKPVEEQRLTRRI